MITPHVASKTFLAIPNHPKHTPKDLKKHQKCPKHAQKHIKNCKHVRFTLELILIHLGTFWKNRKNRLFETNDRFRSAVVKIPDNFVFDFCVFLFEEKEEERKDIPHKTRPLYVLATP